MEITSRTCGDSLVLDLKGQLVLGPATKKLRNTIREQVKKYPGRVVLNMQNVTHLDSCGVGELVGCYTHAKSHGIDLVLLNPRERTIRLLLLTKLEIVFDIFHDEALAVADSSQAAVPAYI
jgi:anti-sigma B factor antagonist